MRYFGIEIIMLQTKEKLHISNAEGLFFIASGVGLSPLYCDHFWPIVPAPDDR
jgi:hypothetical protein